MTTQATAAYGTQLRISDGTPLAPLTITAATNASPIVVTTGTAHNITDVTWVTIVNALGNTAANGSWVAERVDATRLALRGSTGNGAWTSGGTVTPQGTFTVLAELRDLAPVGMTFAMVETSAHDGGGWASSIPTEKTAPAIRVDINLVPAHVTHDASTGLMYLAFEKVRRDFLIVFPNANPVIHLKGWITGHSTVTPVAGALQSSPTLTPDGALTWAYGQA